MALRKRSQGMDRAAGSGRSGTDFGRAMVRAVEMGEQGVGLLAAKAGEGGDMLGWRGGDALDRAKGNQQSLALLRADARDVVQG